jgi:hypothetical protein
MKTERKSDIVFLLGAGASVEAGVFTSEKITDILINYGSYCPSDNSTAIENLLKYIQVRIADYLQVRASEVNFEYILGTLAELSRKEEYPIVPFLGEGDLLVKKLEDRMLLDDVIDKLYALLRELFFIRQLVDYLYPLKDFLNLSNPLDFFTLNYDLSLETAFKNKGVSYTTGYKKGEKGLPVWKPSEFETKSADVRIFKLHGSINWGQFFRYPPPPTRSEPTVSASHSTDAYLYNYPERVEFDPFPVGIVEPPNRTSGMVSLMNFGTRKELLYAESQFAVLFHHFLNSLNRARICIVAGYSFKDYRINKLLEEATVSKKGGLHLVVVDPSLFWSQRENTLLMKFSELEWATFINKPFGNVIRDGSLLEVADKTLNSKSNSKELVPPIPAHEPEETDKGNPDIKDILNKWKILGISFDLAYFWMYTLEPELRELEQCANEADAIKLGKLLMPLNRKARDLCYHLRWVYEAMHFNNVYGGKYLENIKVEPKLIKDFSHMELVRRWLPKLGSAVNIAFNAYNLCTENFKLAVNNLNFEKDIDAPSHLSAVELEIQHDIMRTYEIVCILNDIYKGAGYEEPFEMITKHFAKEQ